MTHLTAAARRAYQPLACLVSAALLTASVGRDASVPDWKQQGVIFLDSSPNARQHPVPVQAVHLGDGFWSQRRRAVTEHSLPSLLLLLEEHGVVDNFRRLAGRPELPRRGPVYTDSDLYKWMEGAAWAIASNETTDAERTQLKGDIESLIGHIAAAQDASGYLNTYYTGDKAHLRFTDLTHSHEDYCLGHLLQAGLAYYRATGDRRLLDIGIRFSDYVVENFGPTRRPFVTGHPELEMALVELYRTTRQTKYLDFARYLLSGVERDRLKLKDSDVRYMFSGRPFTSRTELEGHAVRALYASSGATDYFTEAGDPAYKKTLDLLWADLTMHKMYITGGVGSRSGGESFGDAYELPNEQAYAETCAAIANVMWNYRLLALTGDARYADVLERALYNGVNSGLSLSGNLYCYRNPLASNGEKLRNAWYDTTCCPPNIERLFESLPGYFYSSSRDGIYLNLYHSSELDWHLDDGTPIKIAQATNYPWTGDIRVTVSPSRPANFTVFVRWPNWASSMDVQLNGQPFNLANTHRGSFIPLTRTWTAGDVVTLTLPMQAVMMSSNPHLADDYGRAAVVRGPIVYALEQLDQNGAVLGDIFLKNGNSFTAEFRKDVLGGIDLLKVQGLVAEKPVGEEPLYQPYGSGALRAKHMVNLTFIPYYTIGNRESTPMEVWVPVSRSDSIISSAGVLGAEKHFEK